MWSLFIFLVIIIFKADARGSDNDPVKIIFKLTSMNVENNTKSKMICDHVNNDKQQKIYTVLEGEEFTISILYNKYINNFICTNNNDYKYTLSDPKTKGSRKITTTVFKVEKRMGTVWNCTVLTNRDTQGILPVVHYKDANYAAAYCFMQIHVRQRNSPQTILVNNMALQAVRTDLSEKDVDFTAEYQYADGDVVDVTCIKFFNEALLTMEYAMAGTKSNNSLMKELSSYKTIGFRVKLHSGHNNSHIICTNTESTDYTKVMVRFIMRTEFNIVSIKINEMTLQPKLKPTAYNYYKIDYKYISDQNIKLVCEVQRKDMKLGISDKYLVDKVHTHRKAALGKTAKISFYLKTLEKTLICSSYYNNGSSPERVAISFSAGNFYIDQYPLHMELPSNGTVMELYNVDKLRVIFYEFIDGETLQLKCGPLLLPTPGPVLYLQFNDSDECNTNGCAVSKTLHVTHKDDNTEIICYLKEIKINYAFQVIGEEDKVLREIRVILRERVLTTTSTASHPASSETSTNALVYYTSALGVALLLLTGIILYLSVKNCVCCKRSSSQNVTPVTTPRPDPGSVFYENLLSVFQPINEREAAEMEMENQYEEIN